MYVVFLSHCWPTSARIYLCWRIISFAVQYFLVICMTTGRHLSFGCHQKKNKNKRKSLYGASICRVMKQSVLRDTASLQRKPHLFPNEQQHIVSMITYYTVETLNQRKALRCMCPNGIEMLVFGKNWKIRFALVCTDFGKVSPKME